MKKTTKKLSLTKDTLKNLSVRTGVQTGGVISPPWSQIQCASRPPGGTATGLNCMM
jgi:hypothetical protein